MNSDTHHTEIFAENFQVDLTNCDREPIHIPGLVQPHGVLLAVREPELEITQISENCAALFGKTAAELLDHSLAVLLDAEYLNYLTTEILPQELEANPLYLNPITINNHNFEVLVHRFQEVLILEFECAPGEAMKSANNAYGSLRAKLNEINSAKTVADFCGRAAEAVRKFTGFDRVMIYQFLEDDSGKVIAEAARVGLEPFLGLHYPASDIPQQARALYLKQTLRFKTDVNDVSVPVVPTINPQTVQPLDMSYAATRAMSPIHVEYLKNIGACATMSISIVKDEKLWGLIACHHGTARYISHAARMLCEFLAHTISLQVESKTNSENHEYITRLKHFSDNLISELSETPDIQEALLSGANNLLASIEADGAALVFENKIHLIGTTPDEFYVKKLVEWLWKDQPQDVFATNQISKYLPTAAEYAPTASGILAARLTQKAPEYIIWFRREHAHTVEWAGNPAKPAAGGKFGERLTPRQSFEAWQTEVRGQSKPWQKFEIEFAGNLRRLLVEIILRRIEELRELNKQLEASNTELDSFAYVASHDLKEPLRGINNYSNFLLEDYGEQLDEEAIDRLKTLVRLTDRMENLLDSLLHYSRVGRIDLQRSEADLHDVVQDSLMMLSTRIDENQVEIKIPRKLPSASVDEVRIGEVFTNLISNAIKYNKNQAKTIEIGYLENALNNVAEEAKTEQLFYVRDNGIGIDERHHTNIFRIFKRLHARNEYGGGVGAGLTIVKKIIERHGGRIWLESKSGEGTTFYFTLG